MCRNKIFEWVFLIYYLANTHKLAQKMLFEDLKTFIFLSQKCVVIKKKNSKRLTLSFKNGWRILGISVRAFYAVLKGLRRFTRSFYRLVIKNLKIMINRQRVCYQFTCKFLCVLVETKSCNPNQKTHFSTPPTSLYKVTICEYSTSVIDIVE